MSYPGFCAKYNSAVMAPIAFGIPALIGAAVNFGIYQSVESASYSALYANNAGGLGFISAYIAHAFSDVDLRKKQVGMTRGAKITRQRQAIAYAIPTVILATVIGSFNHEAEDKKRQSYPTESVSDNNQNPQTQTIETQTTHQGYTP